MNDQYRIENVPNQTGGKEEFVAPTYPAPPVRTEAETVHLKAAMPMAQPSQGPSTPPYRVVAAPARPEIPLPVEPEKPAKVKRGVPGVTALGFLFALLSLFFTPLFKEAFSNYLFYDGFQTAVLTFYYYGTWIFGGITGLFALLGLILSTIGGSISKRKEREGRGLAVAGTMIALVALLLAAAIGVSLYLLYMEIGSL